MQDRERIEELEREVADLRAKIDFVYRYMGLNAQEIAEDFRDRLTLPAPPPSGV